jgi:TolB-like protein/Flp pilus assembly protein TadD
MYLLGPFQILTPDGAKLAIGSRKGMALLALLAMSRSASRSRSWLQAQLWSMSPAEQSAASLRRELSTLRRQLNRSGEPPLLLASRHDISLDLSQLEIDLPAIEAAVAAQRPIATIGSGELLEGLDLADTEEFEDWLREQRVMAEDLLQQARLVNWRHEQQRGNLPASAPAPDDHLVEHVPAPRATDIPIRPLVSILPFTAYRAGDADIAHGLCEEIANELSRWTTLAVIRPGPAAAAQTDRARLSADLGVRYIVEGSVRRDGPRVRVAVRLVDGVVGEQLWGNRFDGAIDQLFDVEDRIVAAIAPLIDSSVEKRERQLVSKRPIATAGAHDLYWQASGLMRSWQRENTQAALALVGRVLDLEPGNSWASALHAFGHAMQLVQGWADDPERAASEVHAGFRAAVTGGGDDPYVLGTAAAALLLADVDADAAVPLLARALALNPHMPATLFWNGWAALVTRRTSDARRHLARALELNPAMSVRAYAMTGLGLALLADGDPEAAAPLALEAATLIPGFSPSLLAAALAQAARGQLPEARRWLAQLETAGGLDACFAILRDREQQAQIAAIVRSIAGSD